MDFIEIMNSSEYDLLGLTQFEQYEDEETDTVI